MKDWIIAIVLFGGALLCMWGVPQLVLGVVLGVLSLEWLQWLIEVGF